MANNWEHRVVSREGYLFFYTFWEVEDIFVGCRKEKAQDVHLFRWRKVMEWMPQSPLILCAINFTIVATLRFYKISYFGFYFIPPFPHLLLLSTHCSQPTVFARPSLTFFYRPKRVCLLGASPKNSRRKITDALFHYSGKTSPYRAIHDRKTENPTFFALCTWRKKLIIL